VQIPSTIQQLAFPAQTPVARREHTSSLTWKKEMLTVALGQTPNRDQGSQKKKELRRRKSKPELPNSKSFAEERANVHCQTPKSFGEEQTLTLTILTLAEPTTLYSKPFHEELCLGLWLLQQEGSFHSWIMPSLTWDGLRIRLKGFIRAAPACSQYVTLPKYLAHPSLVIYLFPTPSIKLKLGGRLCNPLPLRPPSPPN
jgi:hypothetical protein